MATRTFCQGTYLGNHPAKGSPYYNRAAFQNCNRTTFDIDLHDEKGTSLGAGATQLGRVSLFHNLDANINRDMADIDFIRVYVRYLGSHNRSQRPSGGDIGEDFYIRDANVFLGDTASTIYGVDKGSSTNLYIHERTRRGSPQSEAIDYLAEYEWTQAELITAGVTESIIDDANFGVQLTLDTNNPSTKSLRLRDVWTKGVEGRSGLRIEALWMEVAFNNGDVEVLPKRKFEITDLCGDPLDISETSLEGLKADDDVQVGHSGKLEDSLRFVLQANGFQEVDPSKPFFYDIEESPFDVNVPPLRYHIEKNVRWGEVINDVMQSAPPNYYQLDTRDGRVVFRPINLQLPEKYEVNHMVDVSENNTDNGIFTRVVALGEGGESINVALHTDSGGSSAVRAYKLNEFVSDEKSGLTKNQVDANAILIDVLDTNQRTPISPEHKYDWGLIYERRGDDTRRWTFEDEDLFVVDLGLNSYVTPTGMFDIDAIQCTVYRTFRDGAHVTQSFAIYGMTESDYTTEYGTSPPATPDQASADLDRATTYMPLSDARSWKLLTEEFNVEEGQTTVEASEFIGGRTVQMRFLKVRCTQAQYRYPDKDKKLKGEAKINLADLKVWTSRQVLAMSELGYTEPFNTAADKVVADRLRRRTLLLDYSPYVTDYPTGKLHSQRELQERSTDFTPVAGNVVMPLLTTGDIVKVNHANVPDMFKDTKGNLRKFFARTISHGSDGTLKVTLANYDIDRI